MKRISTLGAAMATGVALLLLSAPAATAATASTIPVPSGFDEALSDTRATGHYAVQGTGLHIWTEGATSTDKVAEYVDTNTKLSAVGEPSLDYTSASGGVPG